MSTNKDEQVKVVVIDGWMHPDRVAALNDRPYGADSPLYEDEFLEYVRGAVVIGDKAMPMSKVREMVREMLGLAVVLSGRPEQHDHVHEEDIKAIATKYGVDL